MNLFQKTLAAHLIALISMSTLLAQTAPTGPALAAGHARFLGGIHSSAQALNLPAYFNQITPENAGKWGSVEGTRDVMNWAELDAAYALAKANGLPFRFHVLIWGNQQPRWIATLPAAEQLEEIEEWFTAVADRYPDLEYLEVVNEPMSDPPDGVDSSGNAAEDGNYLNALGGTGASGWDWVLTAFRMAKRIFPASTKLMLNEYSITGSTARMNQYIGIVNLLKAKSLIDVVGVQGHYFSTRSYSGTTPSALAAVSAATKANLDLLAATGIPIMVTEMDIDGGTPTAPDDATQLSEYQRIFPIFWEHPAVIGITLWGYRPGLWRNDQAAYLIRPEPNGTERPAMEWLRTYLANHAPTIPAGQQFTIAQGAPSGTAVGYIIASDADGSSTARDWAIVGGTGASVFAIDAATGQLRVADGSTLNAAAADLSVSVTVSDGRDTSVAASVIVKVVPVGTRPSQLVNISTRAHCNTGDRVTIGGFVIDGSAPRRVLIRAVGPSLAKHMPASEVLMDPGFDVVRDSTVIASNDNWVDAANASEITSVGAQLGAAALEANDQTSAALLTTLSPGVYTVIVSGKNNTSGIVLMEVYDADTSNPTARFMNISTRAYATTGNGVAIGGFVIVGDTHKQVLLRAVGFTLAKHGLAESALLSDASIEVNREGTLIASNDNWGNNANHAAIATEGARIGASPLASTDYRSSGLLLTLPPGVYTFIAKGNPQAPSGILLVEVYDAD